MTVPTFVYGLLLLIEAFGPIELLMTVDVVEGGAIRERLLLEVEQTVYRVRSLRTDERRLEIERSRIYGHVFFVFLAPGDADEARDGAPADAADMTNGAAAADGAADSGAAGGIAAVDFSGVFAALAAAQPTEGQELVIETGQGGAWSLLQRGDSLIIASQSEALFLHARPAVPSLR